MMRDISLSGEQGKSQTLTMLNAANDNEHQEVSLIAGGKQSGPATGKTVQLLLI